LGEAMNRDPRTDPQPGDVLRDPIDSFPRTVIQRDGDRLRMQIGRDSRSWCSLETWIRWAGHDRVLVIVIAKGSE
jgi:hypothetical protein